MDTPAFPRWLLLMGALTALAPLSIDMYLPAFPAIAGEFHATGRVELTLAAFFIGVALGQLFYGPVSDAYGRKPPLYVGLSLYMLASLGAAFSSSIEWLTVARLFQGLGGCAGMVIARAIVRDRCPPQEAAKAFSLLMLVMGLAPILAPVLGSLLLTRLSWRLLFVGLALFASACLYLTYRRLPESRPASSQKNLALMPAVRTYQQLLGHRHFMGYSLASSLAFAGMFAYIAGSPFVLMQLHGLSASQYGLVFGANACGLIALSQLNLVLLRRFPLERLMRTGLWLAATAGLALALLDSSQHLSLPLLAAGLFAYTASLGLIAPNAGAAALADQGKHAVTASALMGALQFSLATVSGASMSIWHDGSALPLTTVMALSGLGSLACLLMLQPARLSG